MHGAEALVLEQQLGVLLNAKLDEYEECLMGDSDQQAVREHARFRSEADAIMQQLVALKKYTADHIKWVLGRHATAVCLAGSALGDLAGIDCFEVILWVLQYLNVCTTSYI